MPTQAERMICRVLLAVYVIVAVGLIFLISPVGWGEPWRDAGVVGSVFVIGLPLATGAFGYRHDDS